MNVRKTEKLNKYRNQLRSKVLSEDKFSYIPENFAGFGLTFAPDIVAILFCIDCVAPKVL
jgi:hypothetical protein